MNIIKFFKWLLVDQFIFGFGGGGGGAPSSTTSTGTTYQTNIPEYAQPYVETMLGATQKQLFTMDGNEITGFRPYVPYSTNAADYVASMSPLQQQAMQATGQLQVPGQFAPATDLTLGAGLGSLGAAQQAMGAGQQYAQMATSPAAQQAYMSPYMQNVVDYQKSQALRDYNIGQGLRKAQAVGQGAFGGSRQAIAEAEAERALQSQLQGIAAQGSQQAFQQAQQAQQFGANLGLQGIGAGLQGYGQMGQAGAGLGSLGAQQLAAQQGVLGTKYSMGAQQQAIEQQKINQAIQDWANTQQYPLMQLGVMSNMLRGLPMQSATTNQYVAAPNALTQGIGTVGALGSLGRVFQGGKEGGLPSEFKPATGIKSYNIGGAIKGKLYDMSPEDLREYINETTSPMAKDLAEEVLRDKVGKASGGIIAFKDRGEVEDPEMVRKAYIEAAKLKQNEIPENLRYDPEKIELQNQLIKDVGSQINRAPAPVLTRDAGGEGITEDVLRRIANRDFRGIAGERQTTPPARTAAPAPVAENTVPGTTTVTNVPQSTKAAPAPSPAPAPTAAPSAAPAPAPAGITAVSSSGKPVMEKVPTISEVLEQQAQYMGTTPMSKEAQEQKANLMAEKANAKAEASRQNWMRMAEFFASWGSTPGNAIVAGLNALKAKVPDFISDAKEQKKIVKDIDNSIYELGKADRLERAGKFKEAAEIVNRAATLAERKYGHELSYAASMTSSARSLQAAQIRADATGGAGGENKLLARVEADIGREKKDPTYQKAFKYGSMQITKDTSPQLKARIEAEKANLQKFEDDFERRRAQARSGKDASTAPAAPAAPPAKVIRYNAQGERI